MPSRRTQIRRTAFAIAAGAAISVCSVADASAQGLFEQLFGGFIHRATPSQSSFADPSGSEGRESGERHAGRYGSGQAYCVRTCDGRFFPIPKSANPVETCNSFCPASETKVFSGGGIDHAAGRNGERYADLDNAYVYRDKLVAGCTCNGKDSIGLARLDVKDDPTLRAGDIVATAQGLMAYNGNSRRDHVASYTPIDRRTMERYERLAATKVAPVREPPPQDSEADGPTLPEGSVQAVR